MEQLKLEAIIPILQRNDVAFAGVFGSHARGEARGKSDVDLLIRFSKPKGLLGIVHLEDELSAALGRKVDLVTEGALHPLIKHQVLRDLKLVYGER